MVKSLEKEDIISLKNEKEAENNLKKISKKILFIYRAEDRESLGIEYLSSVLKSSGHKTDLLIYYEKNNFRNSRGAIVNKVAIVTAAL